MSYFEVFESDLRSCHNSQSRNDRFSKDLICNENASFLDPIRNLIALIVLNHLFTLKSINFLLSVLYSGTSGCFTIKILVDCNHIYI